MGELERSLKAIEQARNRKKELKSLIEILFQEYKLVKTEIEKHKECIEQLMSAKEYSAYLDTMELDASLEFPVLQNQKATGKK